jgi:hypothetical protein
MKQPIVVTEHALKQLRERWPSIRHMSDDELKRGLREQIARNEQNRDYNDLPGGRYSPVTFMGDDGFAVIKDNHVLTVLPEEYCQELQEVRNGQQ